MKKTKIDSFQKYIDEVEILDLLGYDVIIYRGQPERKPLLPSIARSNPELDTTSIEKEMLSELKRRSQLLLKAPPRDDWEWLVFAQHFGLKTRLLDWTSNPLVALWFASCDESKINENSYVYRITVDKNMLVDTHKNESPFNNTLSRVLRPSLNNERIIAQSGWFTAHKFSKKTNRFIALDKNSELTKSITEFEISADIKNVLLKRLSTFGINYRTLYPDIIGLCSHLNWKYNELVK